VTIQEFQNLIRDIYLVKDRQRGVDGTFRWLAEEVGELARALRHTSQPAMEEEFADVFAWLVSLANLTGVDMESACAKYRPGCPKCHSIPCRCAEPGVSEKRSEVE
jgi:NTP pyrophosphatase (non-canonical NTP hydrolase)